MKNGNFKHISLVFFVAFLFIFLNTFVSLTDGTNLKTYNGKDFSIIIHRIRQEDEIDPLPHSSGGEWILSIYVNNEKKTIECSGEDIAIDQILTWEGIIQDEMKFLTIEMELLEDDWPDADDIADISAYKDENYYNGKYDDTSDFDNNRPAVFKRYYNLVKNNWEDVDENNDYLQQDESSALIWYVTSGNFDGSTILDENDVTIWFNISVENKPPNPPEKPDGTTIGWVNQVYSYTTKSFDDDGDKIRYGWDWNGDGEIDYITDLYDSWETISVYYGWSIAEIYYVRVCAIDEHGMVSVWSEPLKVEINGPYGKSGFEIDEWSLGHIYCVYLDHFQTMELLDAFRSGGNIVTAAAALISAIAAAAGIPLDISISITIITAVIRLGVEVIGLLDRGMGIYIKTYLVELNDIYMTSFGYAWSQTFSGEAWSPSEDNKAPSLPETPQGQNSGKKGEEYIFTTVSTDPNNDKIAYVFDWGDGNYGCIDYNNSGRRVYISHEWMEVGTYSVRVKAVDIYGFESEWSQPLTIQISKKAKNNLFVLKNIFLNILKNIENIRIYRSG
jgi:hypothetical protein